MKIILNEEFHFSNLPPTDYRNDPYIPPELTEEQTKKVEKMFHLIKKKGVYPYEYVTDLSVLDEQKLPPQSAFYSSLNDEEIKEEDYEMAQQVWDTFRMKTLWNYHDLYLISDVLLLADVLNMFRDMCFQNYNMEPLHSFTAPGFAWQAALKMTNADLELISEKDIYTFLEAGKRGGVSTISHRYAKANIPNHKDFDPNLPPSYLIYLDANNLYGWAMTQRLPTGEFKWVKVNLRDVLDTADDADYGYFLEVDLNYPQHLHDNHNDYPLAAEKMKPVALSPYQQEMLSQQYNAAHPKWTKERIEEAVESFVGTTKLIPNLQPKTKYILHYRLLKQYVDLGMEVTKIHRVLSFRQKAWLKPFIDYNTAMRAAAKSSFEKDFFKLLNNSVFGKTMENTREYRNIELVDSEKKAL